MRLIGQGQPAYPPNLKALRPERPVAEGVATRSSRLKAAIATVVACAMLTAAVNIGTRRPGLETLGGLGAISRLDYSRLPSRLSPLSEQFISRTLGLPPNATGTIGRGSAADHKIGNEAPQDVARTIREHQLTNDDFEDAYPVPSIPFTARTDASVATRDGPDSCAPAGDTVWYRYRPDRDMGLIANTIGTSRAAGLAVFTGSDAAHLTPVEGACHALSTQGNAYVTFAARRNVTYFFQVTQVPSGDALVFNLDPAGTTELVSVASNGEHFKRSAALGSISGDGRFVGFSSEARLDPRDDNEHVDVFVRDLLRGTTELISIGLDGKAGAGDSKSVFVPMSADGRFVAFASSAENLVPDDGNGAIDIFVRDRLKGTIERVSVSSAGREGRPPVGGAGDPLQESARRAFEGSADFGEYGLFVSMTADGHRVVFESDLTGLVPNDGPGAENEAVAEGFDVFVHDRLTHRTSLVSSSAEGDNANAVSMSGDISPDGRFVAFRSSASNLIPGFDDAAPEAGSYLTESNVYLKDLQTGVVELVSVTPTGRPGNAQSYHPAVSYDGRYVAFGSLASDLVPPGEDTNEDYDFFVRDRLLGRTEIVSRATGPDGEQQQLSDPKERTGLWNAPKPGISWDGRYVTFHTTAANLVPGDTEGPGNVSLAEPVCIVRDEDIFVRDRAAHTTTRVSNSSTGEKGNATSFYPTISADGRRIAFGSSATNFDRRKGPNSQTVPGVCTDTGDIFVHTFPVLR